MITQSGLRTQLAEILGTEITDALWSYWIEQGYIQRILTGELSFNAAVYELRRALYAYTEAHEGRTSAERLPPLSPAQADASVRDARFEDLVAWEAGKDPLVRTFRDEVLHGQLVEEEHLDEWLTAHEEAERAMDLWVKDVRISPADRDALRQAIQAVFAPAPAVDQQAEEPLKLTVHLPPGQFPWQLGLHVLHCRVARWGTIHHIPVADGGVLDRVRELAEYLAPRYGWDVADAANFVLTGASQPAPRIRSEVTLVDQLPVMSRITLSIDPSMKANEVARYYDEIRSEITSTRSRELSEKHVELAHFVAGRPEGETWLQRMQAWNHQHRKWAYEQETNFARDAVQAIRRQLYPDYHAPAKLGRPRNVRYIRRSEEDHGQAGQ